MQQNAQIPSIHLQSFDKYIQMYKSNPYKAIEHFHHLESSLCPFLINSYPIHRQELFWYFLIKDKF